MVGKDFLQAKFCQKSDGTVDGNQKSGQKTNVLDVCKARRR